MLIVMKIALVCPASLPATQFGGIMFLCVNISKKLSSVGHDLTIYTTNLDFANNSKTFNKKLPKKEKVENFTIKRTNVWFSVFLFCGNHLVTVEIAGSPLLKIVSTTASTLRDVDIPTLS